MTPLLIQAQWVQLASDSTIAPIPEPKAQMAGTMGMETCRLSWDEPGLSSIKQCARQEQGSSEALSAGLCPVTRSGDAECSPRCQGTGIKSISYQGQTSMRGISSHAVLTRGMPCCRTLCVLRVYRVSKPKGYIPGSKDRQRLLNTEVFRG